VGGGRKKKSLRYAPAALAVDGDCNFAAACNGCPYKPLQGASHAPRPTHAYSQQRCTCDSRYATDLNGRATRRESCRSGVSSVSPTMLPASSRPASVVLGNPRSGLCAKTAAVRSRDQDIDVPLVTACEAAWTAAAGALTIRPPYSYNRLSAKTPRARSDSPRTFCSRCQRLVTSL